MSILKKIVYWFTVIFWLVGIVLMFVLYREFKTIEKERYITYQSDYEISGLILDPGAASWKDANGNIRTPSPRSEVTVIESHFDKGMDVIYKEEGRPVSVAHEVPKSALSCTEEQYNQLVKNTRNSSFVWSRPIRGRHYSESTIILTALLCLGGIFNNMSLIYLMAVKSDFFPMWKRTVLMNLVMVGIVAIWML